jgi:hypothetical protein
LWSKDDGDVVGLTDFVDLDVEVAKNFDIRAGHVTKASDDDHGFLKV